MTRLYQAQAGEDARHYMGAGVRNLQPRLAESFDQMLDEFWIPPLAKLLTGHRGKVRPYGEQIPYGVVCRVQFAELPVRRRERGLRTPEARHVDLQSRVHRAAVITLCGMH